MRDVSRTNRTVRPLAALLLTIACAIACVWLAVPPSASADSGPGSAPGASRNQGENGARSIYYEGAAFPLRTRDDLIAIRFIPGLSAPDRESARRRHAPLLRSKSIEELHVQDLSLVTLSEPLSAPDLAREIEALRQDPAVAYATPVYESDGVTMIPSEEIFVQMGSGGPDADSRLDGLIARTARDGVQLAVIEKTSWHEGNYRLRIGPGPSVDAVALCERLTRNHEVTFAEPNFVLQMEPPHTTNDPLFGSQTNIGGIAGRDTDLDAPEAWEIQQGCPGVKIAILDEGCDLTHPDYRQNILPGWDFAADPPDNDPSPSAWEGHGTACAGIAAAICNNGIGIAGVAGGASIIPVKIARRNYAGAPWTTSIGKLSDGIAWAFIHGADVLSNSWKLGAPSNQLRAAIRAAVLYGRGGKGAVVVFAAGNDGANALAWPARYPEVISVAATDANDVKASFSNYGAGLDCAAPGVDIFATDIQGAGGYVGPGDPPSRQYDNGNYFLKFSGTSAACPEVAGLAALLLCQYPQYQGTEIRARIQQTCDRVGGYGYDQLTGVSFELGYGRINLYRALSGKPQVAVSPTFPSVYSDYSDDPGYPEAWHENDAYEWLGADYSPEAGTHDPADPDGHANFHVGHGADGFDDGVRFHPPYIPGQIGTIDVTASVEDPRSERYRQASLILNLWIDWQSDGRFDPIDRMVVDMPLDPTSWGASNTRTYTLTFTVPSIPIGWHIQTDRPGAFLNARTRLTWGSTLTSADGPAESGEVEDDRILNFVEMFDRSRGFMNVQQNCQAWNYYSGTEGWTCHPAFFPADSPPNGYMCSEIYHPAYLGDGGAILATPSFDLRELTEARVAFDYCGVEMATGRVRVRATDPLGGVTYTIVRMYNDPLAAPPCGPVIHDSIDLTPWCGDGFGDVAVEFQTFWNDPCGTPLPNYQDWKIDNVIVWGADNILPDVAGLTYTPVGPSSAGLGWSAPGDDGAIRQAELYNLRYGPYPIDASNWRHSIWVSPAMAGSIPVPAPPGTPEGIRVDRLSSGMHQYALRTQDEVDWISDIGAMGANSPPTITAPSSIVATEGDLVTFAVNAVDPDFDRMILYPQALPLSADFGDDGAGNGTFTWQTVPGDQGTTTVMFLARDWNGLIGQTTTTIDVHAAPPSGACCLNAGCCEVITPAQCSARGGSFQGLYSVCAPNPCASASDLATHDNGNSKLTVTDRGIIGFTDNTHAQGSGFVYPKTGGTNHIYTAGLWVGQDPGMIASRDYDADPDKEWIVSACPDGRVQANQTATRQEYQVEYTDDGGTHPLGLDVRQTSWSFSSPSTDDDFVILSYQITNNGIAPLNGLYAGNFTDFDMGGQGANDTAGTEANRKLAWMTDASGVSAAVRMLDPVSGGLPMSNLALVTNVDYVYPLTYMLDWDKFGFLTAADPQHAQTNGSAQADYSLLLAAGPFSLTPGESRQIAFAIVGGQSLASLEQNADRAQTVFQQQTSDATDAGGAAGLRTALLGNTPNPFGSSTTIHLELARSGPVAVEVYDVAGRLVRRLLSNAGPSGRREIVWDGHDQNDNGVRSGIYFLRMKAGEAIQSRSCVLMR